MNPNISEWLNLIVRWVHVFAGILWVGTTYYFTWLDGRLAEEEKAATPERPKAQVWMVHSGGFYLVEKQKVPEMLPRRLHWFRWEAAITWFSGMLLLGIVYHLGGLMVDDTVANISVRMGIRIGLGAIVAGWIAYDLLWLSPLGRSEAAGAAVSYLLLVGAAFGLSRVLSGRAAYMHVGALMGTIMAANVWLRILPAQRQMIAVAREGQKPDLTLAARAKQRSKHNTYMAVPVVFIMVSSHFPTATYGHEYNWAVLAVLILLGWGAARIIRRA